MTDTSSRRSWSIPTTCWLWVIAAFLIGWYFSQFLSKIGWNAIELIIANHILGHGAYVTGLDYQTAIAWRPVVPTGIVTIARLFSDNPLAIYRSICGLAFAAMAGTMFLAGRRLWGTFAGHCAAILTLACPALTTELVYHTHSYSHIGTLIVFGPTLLVALNLLREDLPDETRRPRRYVLCGVLWALSYLCRTELLLFAGVHFLALAIVHWRTKVRWTRTLFAAAPFAVIFFAFNAYANYACARDGILIRKPIYGFYMSQGWVDPAPGGLPDIEGEGYRYAIRLYGTPEENKESIPRAIMRNPRAFERRVKLNVGNFYGHFWNDYFFPRACTVLAAAGLLLFCVQLVRKRVRDPLVVPYLVAMFLLTHFVLIFHIDPRYLSIAAPSLILLATYTLASVPCLIERAWWRWPMLAAAVFVILIQVQREKRILQAHSTRNDSGMIAMKALGDHFTSLGLHGLASHNREPHIGFVFPTPSPIAPEDEFLLAYYCDTSYVNAGAEGSFPRGRFYSYKDSPIDFRYVPAAKMRNPDLTDGMRIVSDCENPILGKYYLLQAVGNR